MKEVIRMQWQRHRHGYGQGGGWRSLYGGILPEEQEN
ncbi:hypothetical protein SMB34_10890 [Thalassospira permensis NBRC 106175]|uniref:Uncharacterized protein n=1 Tax=Thalassospira permensis NBRC 106175 TaxID=1353532 RepID=A0ABR4TIV8_9PROT|nr:hypothetical protein SMB34_10890 [Thalassospira permensis NBRC 106175]